MRQLIKENSLFKFNILSYISLLIFSILNVTYGFFINDNYFNIYGNIFSYLLIVYFLIFYCYFISILIKFSKNYNFNKLLKIFIIINPIFFLLLNIITNSLYHQLTNNSINVACYFVFIIYNISTFLLTSNFIYKKEVNIDLTSDEYRKFNLILINNKLKTNNTKQIILYIVLFYLSMSFMILTMTLHIPYLFSKRFAYFPEFKAFCYDFSTLNLILFIFFSIMFLLSIITFLIIGIKYRIFKFRIIPIFISLMIGTLLIDLNIGAQKEILLTFENINEISLISFLLHSLIMIISFLVIPSLLIQTDFKYLKNIDKKN